MNPNIRILHILDHSLPLHSGYSFRSKNIFNAQLRREWAPIALTSPKHQIFCCENRPKPCEEIDGIRYYRSGISKSRVPGWAELRLMIILVRRIVQVAKIEHPHILHAHSPALNGMAALIAGAILGLPVVYEVRAFWEDAAVDHGTSTESSWRYRLTRALETRSCRDAAEVVVLCDGVMQDLRARGIPTNKLTVVFNGVDYTGFAGAVADRELLNGIALQNKRLIGFAGSLYRYEGLDLLVRAVHEMRRQRSDILLVIAGQGEMEAELRDLVRRLNLDSCVVFPGRIPNDRMPGFYALMDVLVYPRYSMRLTELTTPLKPLEAMASGRAVVASNVGGHRELINNGITGLLFGPGDQHALSAVLSQVLDDRELRTSLGQSANNWVRDHHTWDMTTEPYSAVYSRIVSN